MINHSSDSLIPEVEGRRFKSGFWDSKHTGAGWSSLVARRAHNPKVVGSNPAPATNSMAARCSLAIASEAPFGAFLWPKEKWPGGHRHVGQGSAIDAAFAADS